MKENRFEMFKKEIAKISEEKGVDIGVAVSILAHEKNMTEWGDEAMDFYVKVNKMSPEERKEYFEK